jgi:hypothetical protein
LYCRLELAVQNPARAWRLSSVCTVAAKPTWRRDCALPWWSYHRVGDRQGPRDCLETGRQEEGSGIRAAVYARRSVEQRVAEDAKSVTRQKANALTFAEAQGWTLEDRHVFVDDGISGERQDRPGFIALRAVAARREFAHVIVSEQKSLSRRLGEADQLYLEFARLGVTVWSYSSATRPLTPQTFLDRITSNLQGRMKKCLAG